MTHKELFEALVAGKHIGHTWKDFSNVDCYLDASGNLVGRLFDYNINNLIVKTPWRERIPDRGVICKVKDVASEPYDYVIILSSEDDRFLDTNGLLWLYAEPVKKSEIQFMEDFE